MEEENNTVEAPNAPVTLKSAIQGRLSMSSTDSGSKIMSDLDKADPQPREHIMQFFTYEHLPPHLREVSEPFAHMAEAVASTLPRNPERTVALRKLLEAKDAAVRALVAKA